MKIGIDSNDKDIVNVIKETIIDKNHFVIDFSEITSVNKGEQIYRKVIMANLTKLNYYISIEIVNDDFIEHITISYDNCEIGIMKSRCILDIVSRTINNIEYKEGNNYYIVDKVEAPVIKLTIPKGYKKLFLDSCLEKIINKIIE